MNKPKNIYLMSLQIDGARPAINLEQAQAWWMGLSEPWKKAFNEAAMRRTSADELPEDVLLAVYASPAHRFAGPTAPYPNMSFELEDMSGLVGLPNAETIVVTYHRLFHIRETAEMTGITSLFVNNNQIASLAGIENCKSLINVYVQSNLIDSLVPLKDLTNMQTLYCCYNNLSDFEGITEAHAEKMENFFGIPNPIKDAAVMRFEREVGIRCKKG